VTVCPSIPEAVLTCFAEDGKELSLDLEKMKIKDIQVEVDRHSRLLRRKEELTG
jgi:large subunit ribosomal protein L53